MPRLDVLQASRRPVAPQIVLATLRYSMDDNEHYRFEVRAVRGRLEARAIIHPEPPVDSERAVATRTRNAGRPQQRQPQQQQQQPARVPIRPLPGGGIECMIANASHRVEDRIGGYLLRRWPA